VKGRKYGA
jgi:poly(A) polymerase